MLRHRSLSGLNSAAKPEDGQRDAKSCSRSAGSCTSGHSGLCSTAPGSAKQLELPPLAGNKPQTDQQQPEPVAPRAWPLPAKGSDCIPEGLSRAESSEADPAVKGAPSAHPRRSGIPRVPSQQVLQLGPLYSVRHGSTHSHEQAPPVLRRSGGSVPASIQSSDLVPSRGIPRRQLSSLSAVEAAQKAASLCRRASLANILHTMLMSLDHSGRQVSDPETAVSSANASKYTDSIQTHIIIQPTLARIDSVSGPDHAQSRRNSLCLTAPLTVGSSGTRTASQLPVKLAEAAESSSTMHQVSRHAADTMLLPGALAWDNSQAGLGLTVPPGQTGLVTTALTRPESLQDSEPAPKLRRTLSDLALEALMAVENLKCPIIEYRQLRFVRKIGEGSIGQVCHRETLLTHLRENYQLYMYMHYLTSNYYESCR